MERRSSSSVRPLTDHEEIRTWAEERGGIPACVMGTGGNGDVGMIRIDFPGYSGEGSLQEIGWDSWFQTFDDRNLALLVQDETAEGQRSNFNKRVSRDAAEQQEQGGRSKRSSGRSRSESRSGRSSRRSARTSASRDSTKRTRSSSESAGGRRTRSSRAAGSARKSQSSGRSSSARSGRRASGRTSEVRGKKTNSSARDSTRRNAA